MACDGRPEVASDDDGNDRVGVHARLMPFAWLGAALATAAVLGLGVALIAGPLVEPSPSDDGAASSAPLRPFGHFVAIEFEGASDEQLAALASAVRSARPTAHVRVRTSSDGTSTSGAVPELLVSELLVLDDADATDLLGEVSAFARPLDLSAGSFTMGSGFALAFETLARDPGTGVDAFAPLLPTLLLVGSVVLLVFGAVLARRERARTTRPPPTLPFAARVGLGVVLGGLLLAAVQGVSLLMDALGAPIVEQDWLADAHRTGGTTWFAVAFVVAVVAPLGEELMFRGYLLSALAAQWSTAFGVAASSIAFAAVHGHLPGIPAYLIYGIGLAVATLRTRSLVTAIVAHATVNTTAILLLTGSS